MKNITKFAFAVCAGIFLSSERDVQAQTMTFNVTDSIQTWVVPCGVDSVSVDMAGGQGGSGSGTGGRVQCTYPVTPGTTFNIYVGGQGAGSGSGAAGGYNGGGNAGVSNGGSYGSGGGGASDIRVGGIALTDRVIVVGGGGGINTINNSPGMGGGLTGGNSNGCCNTCFASWSTGGTQSAGGLDAVGSGSCCLFTVTPDGSLGLGGNGAGPSNSCNGGDGGGGGGGGYYGGGAGGGYGSGAGGSSYTDPSCANVIHTQGYQSGDGYVTLNWTVTVVPIFDSAYVINNVRCNGGANGSAAAKVTDGALPYTFTWAPGGASSDTAAGLSAGTYTLTVVDACGTTTSASVTITQPAAINMISGATPDNGSSNGSAWVMVSGGVMPYHYLWSPSNNTTDSITGKAHGAYCCLVTDSNGCIDSACATITSTAGVNTIANNTAPITIFPNPNNGQFTVQTVLGGLYTVEIYNVLGEKIYTSALSSSSNNNSINISNQPNGIYMYRVISDKGKLLGQGKMTLQN